MHIVMMPKKLVPLKLVRPGKALFLKRRIPGQ